VDTTWIAGGVGYVRERTVEMGPTIIAVDNIATMNVVDPGRSFAAAIIGAFMILLAAWIATMEQPLFAVPFGVLGLALIVWNIFNHSHAYLAIGTSDGRRTHIVSKNREFLVNVRDMLREKIDAKNVAMTGTINITAARLETSAAAGAPAAASVG
jgi:predicted membrane chloride channel (bestrophin family)